MEQDTERPERVRWWGVEFTPLTAPVMVYGRLVPCRFAILGDVQEEWLTRHMATVPLEMPEMPEPQKGLEWFWQHDLGQRLTKLRAQAEARALVALVLLQIGDNSFSHLSFEERLREVQEWPARVIDAVVEVYNSLTHVPVRGLEDLEAQPDFAPARAISG